MRIDDRVKGMTVAVLPDALARDTIMECIFEMRFQPGHQALPDLLPGLVFGKLSKLFQNVATLPAGQVPKLLRDQNPMLQYAHTHALQGQSIRLMFGNRAVAVSFAKPYPGWSLVRPQILECMTAVIDTQLIGKPERFAIKYVNLLQHGADEFDLSQTNLNLGFGSLQPTGRGIFVRAEFELNGCVSIVEIGTGSAVMTPGQPMGQAGILLNVDTMRLATPQDAADVKAALPAILERVHNTEKRIFFDLIEPQTLAKLGPTYPTRQ